MAAETLDSRTAIIAISGTQGAGKTTVVSLLARRFARGAHIEADTLQQMILSGCVWPDAATTTADSPEITGEPGVQVRLRLHNACLLARSFADAGITAVIDDIIIGERLGQLLEELDGIDFMLIQLTPSLDVVRERERGRGTTLYEEWEWLDRELRENTRRLGLWLDTSNQTRDETVDEILRRMWTEALVSAVAAEPRLGPPRPATGERHG